MIASIPVIESSLTTPRVRIVSTDQPWEWLGAGWKDLWRTPLASISYGLIFVVLGYWMVYMVGARFQYVLALTTGFLLVGPFLALGLYDISRRLEAGKSASLGHALTAWRQNALHILIFGILIGILMIIWARLAALLFAFLVLRLLTNQTATGLALTILGTGLSALFGKSNPACR